MDTEPTEEEMRRAREVAHEHCQKWSGAHDLCVGGGGDYHSPICSHLTNAIATYAAERVRAALAPLAEIGERLRTQDNRATGNPIFVVQQFERIYGFDPDYDDDGSRTVWLHCDGFEADKEERKELDAKEERGEDIPGEWTRTGFMDRWNFVSAFFTEAGAQAYIKLNGHNLKKPRVYVESGWRNVEWETLRTFLLSAPVPGQEGDEKDGDQ